MLSTSLRSSRSTLARVLRHQATTTQRRTLITPTAVRQADIVQELYIRELKAFKPTPIKASDAEGHVQKFTPPKVPTSPQEDNIANDLKAYEDQEVEVEGQAASGTENMPEEDWFEEEDEADAPAAH